MQDKVGLYLFKPMALKLLTKLLLFPASFLTLALSHPWIPENPKPENACSTLLAEADGSFTYWKHEYDENGQLASIQGFDGRDETGTLEYNLEVSWQLNGRVETRRELNLSGEPSGWEIIIVRDEENRIIEKYRQRNGKIIEREMWEYNDAGQLVKHRKSQTGYSPWEFGNDFEYDSQGRAVVRYYGSFPDWFPGRQWRVYYAQDGLSAEVVRSRVSDGQVHSREQLFFDAEGRLIREESPSNAAGDTLSITILTYDDAGRLIQKEYTDEKDGTRILTNFFYDEEERLLQTRSYFDGRSNSWTRDYSCWDTQ